MSEEGEGNNIVSKLVHILILLVIEHDINCLFYFIAEVTQFEKLTTNLMNIMEAKSKLIEEEKLKAIGKRIQVCLN